MRQPEINSFRVGRGRRDALSSVCALAAAHRADEEIASGKLVTLCSACLDWAGSSLSLSPILPLLYIPPSQPSLSLSTFLPSLLVIWQRLESSNFRFRGDDARANVCPAILIKFAGAFLEWLSYFMQIAGYTSDLAHERRLPFGILERGERRRRLLQRLPCNRIDAS